MHFIKGHVHQLVGKIKAKVSFEGIAIVVDCGDYYMVGDTEIAKSQVDLVHPVKASKVTLDLSKYQITIAATKRPVRSTSAADQVIAKQQAMLTEAMREMRRARAVFSMPEFQAKFDQRAEFFKAEYRNAEHHQESHRLQQLSRDFVESTNSLILDVYESKTAAQLKRELIFDFTQRT